MNPPTQPNSAARNILLIVSDQHNPHIAGYAGNPHVRTPNLDRLARTGTRFTNACCTCPVCKPSRMSYMTGKHVHQIENWWNRVPLDPEEMTWARKLDGHGIETTLLGKIDAAGTYENPGFTRCKLSMRRRAFEPYPRQVPQPKMVAGATREASRAYIDDAGAFDPESTQDTKQGYNPAHGLYFQDRQVLQWTKEFLEEKGAADDAAPWVAHIGFEYPHWPYVCPRKYFDMYYPDNIELPFDAAFPRNETLHPALQEWQRWNDLGDVSEDRLRRVLAAYYGMVTCMDDMIGEILHALAAQGLSENTLVIYTSDHGESLGEHGLFFKHSPAAASVGVPLIMGGPGVPEGRTLHVPVSLVDLYPTILDCCGLATEDDRPGDSLFDIISGRVTRGDRPEEGVFAEWHGPGFEGAWYMLLNSTWKYVWYESHPPALYNIRQDPREQRDLAPNPQYAELLNLFERELRTRVDPETVSRKAKKDLGVITADGHDLSRKHGPCGEAQTGGEAALERLRPA